MPFNTLLLTCLKSGKSFGESGARVSVSRPNIYDSKETVLFFSIDDQSDEKSTLRDDLGLEGALCDLVVFYAPDSGDKKVLCLVELKGKDIKHAVEQVTNTCRSLKNNFNNKTHIQQITWKAYILTTGGAHKNTKRTMDKELAEYFGKKNCDISTKENICEFLRG